MNKKAKYTFTLVDGRVYDTENSEFLLLLPELLEENIIKMKMKDNLSSSKEELTKIVRFSNLDDNIIAAYDLNNQTILMVSGYVMVSGLNNEITTKKQQNKRSI